MGHHLATVGEPQPVDAVSENQTKGHLAYIDALRGIAILGVIVLHTAILSEQRGFISIFAITGQRGVQLFYMVSAFTLYLSLESGRPERNRLSNYFIRRFFRIAPLFYFVILINLILKHVAPIYSSLRYLGRTDIALGFLFLNGIRPSAINSVVAAGWSIAVETSFYLILPLIHYYIRSVRRSLLLFVVAAPALHYLSWHLASRSADDLHRAYYTFLWFPVELPVFLLGILTYLIWKQYIRGRTTLESKYKDLSLVLLFASFAFYCACLPFTDLQLYFSSCVFIPLILALSIHPWPILVNPVTRFVGTISYSLYLMHEFVLSFLGFLLPRIERYPGHLVSRYFLHHHVGMPIAYFVTLGLAVPLATLTYNYVEQPGIRLGRWLIDRREGRRGPGTLLRARGPASEG